MIILLFQYRHEVVISEVIFWLFCYATVTINIIVTVSVIEVSLSVSHVPTLWGGAVALIRSWGLCRQFWLLWQPVGHLSMMMRSFHSLLQLLNLGDGISTASPTFPTFGVCSGVTCWPNLYRSQSHCHKPSYTSHVLQLHAEGLWATLWAPYGSSSLLWPPNTLWSHAHWLYLQMTAFYIFADKNELICCNMLCTLQEVVTVTFCVGVCWCTVQVKQRYSSSWQIQQP